MLPLKNKTALVTGASRGIGRAIAKRLAQEGALVAVHYARHRKAADEAVEHIREEGGAAFAVQADLGSMTGIRQMFEALDREWAERTGEARFDILVNNAGVPLVAPLEELTEQALDEAIAVNVKGMLFVIQQALPRLRDGGRILNLSSAVTRIAFPDLIGYSLTKGAVNTITLTLAKALGPRQITVNAIQPGMTETDMNAAVFANPDGRAFAAGLSALGGWAQPEDIADAAFYLSSADSRWVTGQLLEVSGGTNL
ncbi:SDR family oxidoreductase [Paenibacillus sp. CC-CFT747]|nr:SDR family oxidoreductase [Paenibacillus sp. CC-CFT747]